MCIDSDDYVPDNTVEIIADCWSEKGGKQFAGIIGLDYNTYGNLIGNLLPDIPSINLIDITLGKYAKREGDKKVIIRSDLYKQFLP